MTQEPLFSLASHEKLLQHMDDGAVILDRDGRVVWANRAASDLVGVATGLRGEKLTHWVSDHARLDELIASSETPGAKPQSIVVSAVNKIGQILVQAPARSADEPCTLIFKHFASAVSSFDRAITFATHDSVTGLLNREAFHDALSTAATRSSRITVVCTTIDQFSHINDVYGHADGDIVLRIVAQRLLSVLGPKVSLARLYGARFAFMLCVRDGQTTSTSGLDTDKVVDLVRRAMLSPVIVGGRNHSVTASIGFAICPDAVTAGELLSAAETAVRMAGESGAGRVLAFERSMLSERRNFLQIESDLRDAIATNQLRLVYQPKVRWSDGRIVGFEALARWTHPSKGPVSPGQFVPVAEKCGLAAELGRWAVEEAARQMTEWKANGLNPVPVAVNLSPRHVLIQAIDELLEPVAHKGLPQHSIEIEITEGALMDQLASTPKVIDSLRSAGVRISIDDFGTGHSSLANLRRLPIHTLKIDRSFVEDLEHSKEAHDIVATIVGMARSLSLEVIAEGVETQSQGEILARLGVSQMQGYLFSRPLSAEDAATLLAAHAGRIVVPAA